MYIVKISLFLTSKKIAAELTAIDLRVPLNCIKSYILFNCFDPQNNYNNNR